MAEEKLRVIIDDARPPDMNMAIDEVLTRSMQIRGGSPFVRFYRWNPPSMSFGYFQPVERLIDRAAAAVAGIGVVRRQSGGKMVFHADEITFSIGMPMSLLRDRAAGTVYFLGCFQSLMQPLIEALVAAGVPARFSGESEIETGRSDRVHCYAAAAGHSIYAGERKLVGAAGIIRGDILTVHGSLPVNRTAFPSSLLSNPARGVNGNDRLPEISVLSDFLSLQSVVALPEGIATCIASKFGLEMVHAGLCEVECREIDILSREKYSRLDWKTLDPASWEGKMDKGKSEE